METRVQEVIRGIAETMGATVEITYIKGYPSLQNDADVTEIVRQAAVDVAGEDMVVESELGLGGEDFSYFSLEVPSCFFRCGTRNDERGIVWGHHHPKFDVEEEGFVNGMATMATAAMKYLNQN
jgi:metal-dependent amidase/aminoacylase/carboxypeptidase family protein